MSVDRYSVFGLDGSRASSGLSRPDAISALGPGSVLAREMDGGPGVPTQTSAGTVVCPASQTAPVKAAAEAPAPAPVRKASPRRGRAAKENRAT